MNSHWHVQEKKHAVASAVVAEAAHKQHKQVPAGSSGFQGDVNAAAATFLQGLLGEFHYPPSISPPKHTATQDRFLSFCPI